MTLGELLFRQGFGTRRECAVLLRHERVAVAGSVVTDDGFEVDPEGFHLVVAGLEWICRARALLVLNKPAGFECSHKPRHHPSVYTLLPAPLRQRGVQAVGRLDADTTGVLLFTEDGDLIHRLTSPKHHVEKVYEAVCKHPVDPAQVDRLCQGVLLHDADTAVRALSCVATGPNTLRLTLTEGKYHQVRRMIAAAGNRVETLQRISFGAVRVDEMAHGAWRWLSLEEAAAFDARQL